MNASGHFRIASASGFALICSAAVAQEREFCVAAELRVAVGAVEVVSAQGAAVAVRAGMALCPGDRVRVPETAAPGVAPQAALWFPEAQKLVRMGAGAEAALPGEARPQAIDLARGALYVLSAVRRFFEVRSDLVTAGIDGTEATVHRAPGAGAAASVREGVVSVRAAQGGAALSLSAGETAFAPEDGALRAVGPADADALPAVFRGYVVSATGAADWTARVPPALLAASDAADAATARLLAAGRVDEALRGLDCAGAPERRDERGAVCAMLAASLGRREATPALPSLQDFAAAAATPEGSTPWLLAQSYVRQALGRPDAARAFAAAAAAAAPDDPFAAARLAELDLILGDAGAAAARLEPIAGAAAGCRGGAYPAAVLGLARLARWEFEAAGAQFYCAIAADAGEPLAWTGRGLLRIRLGGLADGREDLETAALLDPLRASTRVWLGRALLDEGRPERARRDIDMALEQDPDDPNAWLLSAIDRFAANDPVGALRDIAAAEALGPGRATVRSVTGLGEDEAVRGAALGRIYDVLGFDRLAFNAGARAVEIDPTSPAASRFLSDAYLGFPGASRAASSELLRSNLLSPPNGAPIQPQLLASDLALLDTTGAARVTFAEFAPLFDRNGLNFQGTIGGGTQETFGDEISAVLLHDRVSFGIGQFHYQTDGYRENNDIRHDLFAAQGTAQLTPEFSLFGQYLHRDTEAGDRLLRFDEDETVSPLLESGIERDAFRLGGHLRLGPALSMIGFLHYSDTRRTIRNVDDDQFFPLFISVARDVEAWGGEAQVVWTGNDGDAGRRFDLIAGIAGGASQQELFSAFDTTGFAPLPSDPDGAFSADEVAGYAYAGLGFGDWLDLTLGVSLSAVSEADSPGVDNALFAPKLGARLKLGENISLRAAALKAMSRRGSDGDVLEPTAVAGFLQTIDARPGAELGLVGLGLDVALAGDWWVTAEGVARRIEAPDNENAFETVDEFEALLEANHAIGRRWAVSAGLRYLRTESDGDLDIDETTTFSAPLSASWFSPTGLFVSGALTPVHHEFEDAGERGDDRFVIGDLAIGYRPRGVRAVVTFEVQNLFDSDIGYAERPRLVDRDVDALVAPTFARDRVFLLRAAIAF